MANQHASFIKLLTTRRPFCDILTDIVADNRTGYELHSYYFSHKKITNKWSSVHFKCLNYALLVNNH